MGQFAFRVFGRFVPPSFFRRFGFCRWEEDKDKRLTSLRFFHCSLCGGQVAHMSDDVPDRCNARLAFTKINFDDPDDPAWKKEVGRKK